MKRDDLGRVWCGVEPLDSLDPAINKLRWAIKRSGLSARQYAKQILVRDERTIRRWLSGESPIPDAVLRFLEKGAAD